MTNITYNILYNDIMINLDVVSYTNIYNYPFHTVLKNMYQTNNLKKYDDDFLRYMLKNDRISDIFKNIDPSHYISDNSIIAKTKKYQFLLLIWLKECIKYHNIFLKIRFRDTKFKLVFKEKQIVKKHFNYLFSKKLDRFYEGYTSLAHNSAFSYCVSTLSIYLELTNHDFNK